MNKLLKNIVPPLMAALLAAGCNSGASAAAEAAPDWQNEVTISHSSSFPYSLQGVNSYWLTVSNQTANSLRLTKVFLIETSLDGIDINKVVDISSCKTLASGADCQLKISLPDNLAISGNPLIYFSLNYINDKTGESYVVKKALTLYTNPGAESGTDFEYSTKYLNQRIVDTAKSYSIAIPFKLTQDYKSLALNVTGAKVLSQQIICSDGNDYHQGDSCSALLKFDRNETHPQLIVKGITSQGVTNNFAVNLNITPNVVASLVYLNAPLLLNPASPTRKVTILNSGAASAKNINFTFANPEQVGVSVNSDCSGTTLAAGASCHLTYTLDSSKYLSGAPQERITYTNGTALAGKTVDSYYVYTIPPIKSTIKITTTSSSGSNNIGNLLPGQYFTVNATLSGVATTNQTVSVSNLKELQAVGMTVVSTQNTNPTTCILNSTNTNTTSCSFYVVASGFALASGYTLKLGNSSGNTAIDNPNITFNIVTAPTSDSTIHLPQTGQTSIYSPLDDGSYMMGESWAKGAFGTTDPAQRFTVDPQDANCIIDNLTGLEWPKNGIIGFVATSGSAPLAQQPNYNNTTANLNKMDWNNALTAVTKMNNASAKLCGYNDWHLPTVNELSSMLNDGAGVPMAWLNLQGFSNVQTGYWSSSTNASSIGFAWIVVLSGGGVTSISKTATNAFVWPVRLVR